MVSYRCQGRIAFCSEMQLSRSGEAAEIYLFEDAESSFWLAMVGQLVSVPESWLGI